MLRHIKSHCVALCTVFSIAYLVFTIYIQYSALKSFHPKQEDNDIKAQGVTGSEKK